MQTLSLAFEAVTRVHFPEALGHVALRLVPCPPICAAAYALVSKYWSGVEGWGTARVSKVQIAWGSRDQRGPTRKGGGGQEADHWARRPPSPTPVSSQWFHHKGPLGAVASHKGSPQC